ncbi:MAG: tetratricopeptide repeat protein [Saprospiraceae bacterium]|nr:tetratricopeptide repeat protein [Saprospiraceae bacterium]
MDFRPKNYTVNVIDDNGCIASLEVELNSSAALSIEIVNKLEVSCRQSNGEFTAVVKNGTPPYTYSIGGAESTNPTFDNLAQGNYTLTVKDKNGCISTQNVVINATPDLSVTIENLQNASCDKLNGQFTVQATGGTAPYTYNVGNGTTNNPTFTNLAEGTYTVTVTDARNCREIHVATVAEAAPIQANVVNKVAANCGEAKGAFTVLANGGTMPYQYNIGRGATSNNRFENLASGNYNLTITDSQGCLFQTVVEIVGTSAPTLSMGALVAANCGQNNGAVTINAQGGRMPYTFNIGNGAVVNPTFQNLAAGIYQVAVTDASGCANTISFTVPTEGGTTPVAQFSMDTTGLAIELVTESKDGESIAWDLGDGTTYDMPRVIHEYKLAGEYKICLTLTNSCGSNTYCETILLNEVKAVASLSGWIRTELGQAIANVTVKQQTNALEQNNIKTAADGAYAFAALPIGENYKIVPERLDNLLNGVSTYDLFLINNHILTTQPLDSPYKIIAADVDGSGAVTTFDVVSLRKTLLGIANEFPDGNPSAMTECETQAEAIKPDTASIRMTADREFNRGCEYLQLSQFEAAMHSFQQAYALFRQVSDQHGQGKALGSLGQACYSLRNYAKAIEYAQRGMIIAQAQQDQRGVVRMLATLGNAYRHLKQPEQAIEYQQQSLVLAQILHDRRAEMAR